LDTVIEKTAFETKQEEFYHKPYISFNPKNWKIKMKKIIVTGSGGYVGIPLCEELLRRG